MTVVDLSAVRARIAISADLEMAASCLANARKKIVDANIAIDPEFTGVLLKAPDFLEDRAARIEMPAHETVGALVEGV